MAKRKPAQQKRKPGRSSSPPRSESTRDRLISEAVRLFATQGYRGTSVAEIEAAAGLKPGNGSLYTHFRSKEEVLGAAMERMLASTRAAYPFLELLPLGDLRAELTLLARAFLEVMHQWRDYLLIVMKESERFPELFGEVRSTQREGFVWFADWLRTKVKAGDGDLDCDALAAITLGGLSNYWQQLTISGAPILDVETERFVVAWVDVLQRVLESATNEL
jgi:AcrR family transcriptional regulator